MKKTKTTKSKAKFKVRYIFITLGIIALIVIGIIMRKTFIGKFIFIALGIIVLIVIGIVMRKIFKEKFKVRYIFITLGIIIVLFVISNIMRLTFAEQIRNMQKTFEADMTAKVNSIVDERLAEFYSNQSSYTPSNPNSIPDASDNFTDVSWPEDSTPVSSESTPSAESQKIVATIANTEDTNLPYTAPCNLGVYEAYDGAFDNAPALESGRYVRITLKANVEVEDIKSTVSVFNPESDEFEDFNDFSFKSSTNSNNEYHLTFKIPDNPYIWGYTSDSTNIVIVFTIITNEGTFYVSCAY